MWHCDLIFPHIVVRAEIKKSNILKFIISDTGRIWVWGQFNYGRDQEIKI